MKKEKDRRSISWVLYTLKKRRQPFILMMRYHIIHATYPNDNLEKDYTPFLFGFASSGVYHAMPVTSHAVCSYHTFSPLPITWRFIFCGTFPKVTLAGHYPALFFHEAQTFLSCKNKSDCPTIYLPKS